MKNLTILFFTLFSLQAFSFVDGDNTYQPQWVLQSIDRVNGEYVATITAPISFCADKVIKVEHELSADQHGKILVVRSIVQNNSHYKIFCMTQPQTISTTITLGRDIDITHIELINDNYHF